MSANGGSNGNGGVRGEGVWVLSQKTGVTLGLTIALFSGVATIVVMLLNIQAGMRADLKDYVTRDQFETQMKAIQANIEKGRAETRADIANLRADLLIKLAEAQGGGAGNAAGR